MSAGAGAVNPDIDINITGYTAGARASEPAASSSPHYGGAGGSGYTGGGGGGSGYTGGGRHDAYGYGPVPHASDGGGSWETFYTNEGVPYYVNNMTGVTQWEAPR